MKIVSFKGAGATSYAKAMEILVKRGDNLDDLNSANHYALEHGQISLQEFQEAARVLAREILKR